MAWFGLDKLLLGVDLDAEQQRSDQANAQLGQLNQNLVDQGLWTQSQADQAAARIQAADQASGAANVVGAVDQAFGEGWNQGVQNIKSTIGGTISGFFKAIPWQLWIVLGIVAFVWLGGLEMLKGSLANKRK